MRVKIVLKKYTLPVVEDNRKIIKLLASDGKRFCVDMNMLANGSKYIQKILKIRDYANGTNIFIPNVSSSQWQSLVELLLCGRTKVEETKLDNFLGIANMLKIKGMKRCKGILKQNHKEVENLQRCQNSVDTILDDTMSMMFQNFDL